MIKTIELRKAIQASLKLVHQRVYFNVAPETAAFPYLVFDLPNALDEGSLEVFTLEVDGWDNSTNTTALETLMDNADKEIHRKILSINGVVYRINRLSLTDDDPKIKRRKYVYQVRTY